MAGYANLQLLLARRTEAAQERIIYVVTAYMDAQGMMPCGRESAERSVRFTRGEDGIWAVFDDEADRMDIRALDGLGRCLTGKLHAKAVGIMGTEQGRMLRLYVDGRLRDTCLSSSGGLPPGKGSLGRLCCRGRAIRWRPVLREGRTVKELSEAFVRSRQAADGNFSELRELLSLGSSAGYGFAALEEAAPPGLVTLYFCAANRVRQRLVDRLFNPTARTAANLGALIRPPRCRLWQ